MAPAHIPAFSPVQEMNISPDSAGALIVQHDHSAGAQTWSSCAISPWGSSALPALPTLREGWSRCWGEGLPGAPESSSLILCWKFTAVTGMLTAIQRSQCPPDFGFQCSLT